ncbi:MAG TPA: glycine cleavage system aminomethyltransferase GcvT [Miltoncostaeaceae bacterium]|nr:glycine cleavage system aminomethyltransferase GcvT [Miltoncostaeaceae bacterium]
MASALLRTPLHDRHRALGAKLAGFAGWEMPIVYTTTRAEHRAVRERSGLFDVSHMGQIEVTGPAAREFLDGTLTNDLGRIGPGQGQYTLLLQEDGGVVDDLIVYALLDRFLIVCNAANVDPVRTSLTDRAPEGAEVNDRSAEVAMLALQGPAYEAPLAPLVGSPAPLALEYFEITEDEVAGVPALVARTGYTGEPGVEIMCPVSGAGRVWDRLMAGPDAPEPAGLAARDTLRLEVGYPLYGQDLSRERTPIEAGLAWACDLEGGFVGVEECRRRKAEGPAERLVMMKLLEPGIPRPGCAVLAGGEPVGEVTSGTLSPTLDVGIAMGYLRPDVASPGTDVMVDIRGKQKAGRVERRPLVQTSPTKAG